MKKILLMSVICLLIGRAYSQNVVFNEVLPDPSSNPTQNEEYIELFNTTGSTINLDCYTIVAYDFLNGGAWVYNIGNVSISNLGYLVFASNKPIDYKCGTKDSTNIISWNTLDANSSLCYYDRVGNALVNPVCGGPTIDFIPIAGGNSAAMAIMLFDPTGTLVNGFFTNNSGVVPSEITSLASLSITVPGACTTPINLNFAGIAAPEAEVLTVTSAVGQNNNYFRDRDGFCGTWHKGQSCNNSQITQGLPEFTPGTKNSNLPPINTSTAITIASQQGACGGLNGGASTSWDAGVTINDATLLDATVRFYADQDHSLTLTPADGAQIGPDRIYTLAQLGTQVNYTGIVLDRGDGLIVQVISVSGCVQVIRVFATACIPLPVNFKSFTAVRNQSNVLLRWETMTEQNNTGFAIERNTNGSWQQVAFVPSQALNGTSNNLLTYTYNDLNSFKGISQYRIRQIDFDNRSTTSEVKAVRGENNKLQLLVYPNPSNNGKVNVVFEDASAIRDVSLSDMAGRMIKQMKGITNNNIQFENLMPGVYTLQVIDRGTGEQNVQKIVVNKR